MYCWNCGTHIRDNSVFCSSCGVSISRPAQPEPASDSFTDERKAERPHKKRNVKKAVFIVLLCAAALALTFVIIEVVRASLYGQAVALMTSDPLKAKAEFQSLGSYKESADKAEVCQNIYDYDTASDMMDSGNYEGALKIFDQLGGYEDSKSKTKECQNALDYSAAAQKMDSGDMQGALEMFLKLEDYSDSAQKAHDCLDSLDYDKASSLMAQKNFSGAYDIFIKLGNYKDSVRLAMECGNKRDYAQAEEYCDAGKYYSAYKLFTGLGDYLDSAKRAAACARPYPKTGRNYTKSGYNHGNRLVIKAPKDGYYTYIKIYTFDISVALDHPEDAYPLVAAVFLAPGKTVKIKLPEGNFYTVKQAYGKTWYGSSEMFGDDGTYTLMKFKDDDGTYEDSFWSNIAEYYGQYYVYTLKLRQSTGNVNSTTIDSKGF